MCSDVDGVITPVERQSSFACLASGNEENQTAGNGSGL